MEDHPMKELIRSSSFGRYAVSIVGVMALAVVLGGAAVAANSTSNASQDPRTGIFADASASASASASATATLDATESATPTVAPTDKPKADPTAKTKADGSCDGDSGTKADGTKAGGNKAGDGYHAWTRFMTDKRDGSHSDGGFHGYGHQGR
jgi:cytoskeletal protein RodZ